MALTFVQKKRVQQLRTLIRAERDAYYNTDTPLVSDAEFNAHIDELTALDPHDPILNEVGAEPQEGKGRPPKVKLPYAMPSLSKVRVETGLEAWLRRNPTFTASDKLDGISLQVVRKQTLQLITRGSDVAGQDITPRGKDIRGIGRLKVNQAVRGEVLILNATFAKHFEGRTINGKVYKNPRNLMGGVVNSVKPHPGAPHAVFIAYESLNPPLPLARAAPALKAAGFAVVPHRVFNNATMQDVVDYYHARKAVVKYDMDGLVLEGADGSKVAFKLDNEPITVEVERVEWKLSQFGVYRPTVKLVQHYRVGGVDVIRPTGHNARFIINHGIGPGAQLLMIRAGDVIPKIVGTIRRAKPNFPPSIQWENAKKINIIPKQLDDKQERLRQVRRMETGLRVFGIEGIREASVDKLYGGGITSLPALFSADLAAIEASGLGAVYSRKLHERLQRVRRTVTHPQMMQASGVWPTGFTTVRFGQINAKLPYARMIAASRMRLTAAIAREPGWSRLTAPRFVEHLDAYAAFLEELGWMPRDFVKTAAPNGRLSGQSFVFSKVRSSAVESWIKAQGGEVKGSVGRGTAAVIVNSTSDDSTKITAARTAGITVLTLQQFQSTYMTEAP